MFQTDFSRAEMQQEQPQFYASLANHLSAEEQTIIQSIMTKADEIAAQQQAQQAQMLAQQQQGGVDPSTGGASQ